MSEPVVDKVKPSTSTVVTTAAGPVLAYLLATFLQAKGIPLDENTAAGIGSMIGGLLGLLFKGGRAKDVK